MRLNERFQLGADELQWILYRKRGKPDPWKPHGVAIAFFLTKAEMLRCLTYKCFDVGPIEPEAEAFLATLPATRARSLARV